MTIPNDFINLTDLPESEYLDDLAIAVESRDPLKPTACMTLSKITNKMRTDSASQLGFTYKKEWTSGDVIPSDAKNNKLAYWHRGQLYSVGTNTGFVSNDFEVDLEGGRFVSAALVALSELTQTSIFEFTDLNPSEVTDWLPIHDLAVTKIKTGCLVFPKIKGGDGYPFSNTVWQKSNLTYIFQDVIYPTTILSPYECMVSPEMGGENITTYNIKIDCKEMPAVSGILPRRGCKNVKYYASTVINTKHDFTRKGGRATSVHGGKDAPGGNGNTDIMFIGLHAENCYQILDVSGDIVNKNERVIYSGVTGKNCESFANSFNTGANYDRYPLPSNDVCAVVTDAVLNNVGVSTTYTRNQGVMNFAGGGNITFGSIRIYNDASYTSVKKPNILMGKFSGVNIESLIYEGECGYVIDGHLWDESNATSQESVISITDNELNISVNGAVDGLIFAIDKTGGGVCFTSTSLTTKIKNLTPNGKILTSNMSATDGCNLNFLETSTGKGVQGSMSAIAYSAVAMTDLSGVVVFSSGLHIDSSDSAREGVNKVIISSFHPSFDLLDKTTGASRYRFSNDSDLLTISRGKNTADLTSNLWQYNSVRQMPAADNEQALGAPSNRITDGYFVNAPTGTCDKTHKTDYKKIPDTFIEPLLEVVDRVELWRWVSAVNEKGDNARYHASPYAQDVYAIFAKYGIDAFKYGFVGKDAVTKRMQVGVEHINGVDKPIFGDVDTGDEIWNVRATELQWLCLWAIRKSISK